MSLLNSEYYFQRKDFDKAFTCAANEVGKGSKKAHIVLANCYLSGLGVNVNYKLAIQSLEKASTYPEALKMLGNCYFEGIGVYRNYEKAFDCYVKAKSWKDMGDCYFMGKGVRKNYKDAYYFYNQAKEHKLAHEALQKYDSASADKYYQKHLTPKNPEAEPEEKRGFLKKELYMEFLNVFEEYKEHNDKRIKKLFDCNTELAKRNIDLREESKKLTERVEELEKSVTEMRTMFYDGGDPPGQQ